MQPNLPWRHTTGDIKGANHLITLVKRSARAILLDGDQLVLIKRTRPGRQPYWTTVGGGMDAGDPNVEDALLFSATGSGPA